MNKNSKDISLEKNITNQLRDAFPNSKRVTKSHIPDVNDLTRIKILIEQSTKIIANESKVCQKRCRPTSQKTKILETKGANNQVGIIEEANIHKDIDITNHKTLEEVLITLKDFILIKHFNYVTQWLFDHLM
jgi:biotin synthase-related radical SAM superfamily protein